MAEQVQAVMESMIPVFEDLKFHKIFSDDEVTELIRRRRDFEYKLKRRISEKEDFLRYIDYELTIEFKRRQRVHVMNEAEHAKKPSISDFAGVRHVHYIFKRALRKFHGDISLWLTFIDFCKRFQSYKTLGKVFAQALRHHPLNEGFWILAASWEYNHHENTAAARTLFQRGLRFIPECPLLWSQYFLFELVVSDQIKLSFEKSLKENENYVLNDEQKTLALGAIPKLVLENALSSMTVSSHSTGASSSAAHATWIQGFVEAYETSQADFPAVAELLNELLFQRQKPLHIRGSSNEFCPLDLFKAKLNSCLSEGDIMSIETEFIGHYESLNLTKTTEALELYGLFLEKYQNFRCLDIIYSRLSTKIIPGIRIVSIYLRLLSLSPSPVGSSLNKFHEKLLEWMVNQEPREPSHWLALIQFSHINTAGLQPQKVIQLYQKAVQALGQQSSQFILQYQKIIQ